MSNQHRPQAFAGRSNLELLMSDSFRKKFGLNITFLIFCVIFSSCVLDRKPELSIPNKHFDSVFISFINPITEKHDILALREKNYKGNDFEIRVWVENYGADGFILKYIEGKWSAIAIKETDCKELSYYPKQKKYQLGKIILPTPKTGWENTWQKLVEAGILELPGSDVAEVLDGIGYIVEINQNGKYRIYFYRILSIKKEKMQSRC